MVPERAQGKKNNYKYAGKNRLGCQALFTKKIFYIITGNKLFS